MVHKFTESRFGIQKFGIGIEIRSLMYAGISCSGACVRHYTGLWWLVSCLVYVSCLSVCLMYVSCMSHVCLMSQCMPQCCASCMPRVSVLCLVSSRDVVNPLARSCGGSLKCSLSLVWFNSPMPTLPKESSEIEQRGRSDGMENAEGASRGSKQGTAREGETGVRGEEGGRVELALDKRSRQGAALDAELLRYAHARQKVLVVVI